MNLLLQELKSPARSRRERAVELLAKAAADEAVPALRTLLQDEEHLVVRWKALHAIQRSIGASGVGESTIEEEIEAWREQVVNDLLRQLRGKRASRRWEAAEGLGRLGDSRAVPALVEALRDAHVFVRWAAAQALGQIRGAATIPLLLPMIEEPDPAVRSSVVDALGHFDTADVYKALHQAVHDSDPMVQRNAIEAVARLKYSGAVDALVLALDPRSDFWVRYSAAEALGIVGDHRAIPPLIEAARDDQVLLRRVAVCSLGLLRDSRAIPSLVQALEDEDPQVRLCAADGLGRVGHEGVLPHLKPHVRDSASVFGREVGEAVRQAIELIQNRPMSEGKSW